MFCPRCSNEDCQIIEVTEPLSATRIVLAVLFFPIGLLFLIRGKKTKVVCKKCGNKFDI